MVVGRVGTEHFWYIELTLIATFDVCTLRATFDLRSSAIHVNLLARAILSFLLQKYGLVNTEYAFIFGFMAVKTFIDLWAVFR